MASEITQRQRAEAVVDTVKAELPPIWLGGRQRMVLVDAIVTALEDARQEALRDAIKVVGESEGDITYAIFKLDRLAREGVK